MLGIKRGEITQDFHFNSIQFQFNSISISLISKSASLSALCNNTAINIYDIKAGM